MCFSYGSVKQTCGLFCWGSILGFRSVSTKESYRIATPRTPEPTKTFNPHLYQTGSKKEFCNRMKTAQTPQLYCNEPPNRGQESYSYTSSSSFLDLPGIYKTLS